MNSKTKHHLWGIVLIFSALVSIVISVKPTNTGLMSSKAVSSKPSLVYSYHQAKSVGRKAHLITAKKPATKAKAYIVLNRKTGAVLLQKNSEKQYLVASTSKLMTIYLASCKLAKDPQGWQQRLSFSKALIKMGKDPEFNDFRVKKGRQYTVKQILEAAIIDSDDNAAIRLGEWVAGSNRDFIKMMNQQAKLWHLKGQFTSASGLENRDLAHYGYYVNGSRSSGNLLSAKSLGIIAYHIAHDYPKLMKYFSTNSVKIAGQRLVNQNRILPGQRYYYAALKPDGMKTGWTPQAGYCFVGSSRKGDGLITVTLNDPSEFSDTVKLMRFTYRHLAN